MKKSRLLVTVCAYAISYLSLSTNVNAALIEYDTYTLDTTSGLEWLDLAETANRTYDDISSQLGIGGEFEGWRYATSAEVESFLDEFGGNNAYYNGWSTQNNGLFDIVSASWGDLYCEINSCATGDGRSGFFYKDQNHDDTYYAQYGQMLDLYTHANSPSQDYIFTQAGLTYTYNAYSDFGSALVRSMSPVPVPAAVWLFASGLLGLIGISRRKK